MTFLPLPTTAALAEPYEPALPSQARTRNGAAFYPNADVWVVRDATLAVRFDFGRLEADEALIGPIKRTLLWYLEHMSAATAEYYLRSLHRLLKTEAEWIGKPVTQITAESIFRYRGSLNGHDETSLVRLTGCLKRWYALGLPGITEEAIHAVNRIRRRRSTRRAEAIRTMDPYQGPFTNIEEDNLSQALKSAFAREEITLEDYILASLFPLLGVRPIQLASLKTCDFIVTPGQRPEYFLNVPRAKQRHVPTRHEFTQWRIVADVGRQIAKHVQEVERRFSQRLSDPSQAPMFPTKDLAPNAPQEFAFHPTAEALSRRCSHIYHSFNVLSERTGNQLIVKPRRFRYSLGTRAAEAEYSPLVIAGLLDHTTTECVTAYVEATHTIRKRIGRAMALELAPYVNAFRGIVTAGGHETESKDEAAHFNIADPRFDPSMRNMGTCAHHGPCNLLAPLACYTCPFYRPWDDGPHDRVLEYLLRERDRLYSERGPLMASNFDLLIFAAARVVQLCNQQRSNGDCPGTIEIPP